MIPTFQFKFQNIFTVQFFLALGIVMIDEVPNARCSLMQNK